MAFSTYPIKHLNLLRHSESFLSIPSTQNNDGYYPESHSSRFMPMRTDFAKYQVLSCDLRVNFCYFVGTMYVFPAR
jgi:hypothetical protein